MPDISEYAGYLVGLLHSAGTASATGMGLVGLSWNEIKAWAECTNSINILSPRELKAVHTLSRAYSGEYSKASTKGAKPPYEPIRAYEDVIETDEAVLENISAKAEDVFANMIASQAGRKTM